MNGTVSVESEVGVGTRFLVSFPSSDEPDEVPDLSVLEPAVG
jgi:signal transduction histidine kinase